MHFYEFMDSNENNISTQSQISELHALSTEFNQDHVHLIDKTGNNPSNAACPSMGILSKEDHVRLQENLKDLKKSPLRTSLNLSLEDLLGGSNCNGPFLTDHLEGSETKAESPTFQRAASYPILPSLSKPTGAVGAGTSKVMVPQVRVARPPAEGRGKNQLLPRYWPRITDQELQQLSGEYP